MKLERAPRRSITSRPILSRAAVVTPGRIASRLQESISATTRPATRILRRSSSDLFTAPSLGAAGLAGGDHAGGDLVGGAPAVHRYGQGPPSVTPGMGTSEERGCGEGV